MDNQSVIFPDYDLEAVRSKRKRKGIGQTQIIVNSTVMLQERFIATSPPPVTVITFIFVVALTTQRSGS